MVLKEYISHVVLKIRIELNPLLRAVDPRAKKYWISERAMVSTLRRYCYFRVPKSANSTITRTLAFHDPDICYNETHLAADKEAKVAKKRAESIFSVKEKQLEDFVALYTLFTFVRNPYTRVLSAFLDKIMTDNKISALRRSEVELYSASGRAEASFEGFIRFLEAGGLFLDPHWCPQVLLLPVPPDRLSFIGRVENLDADLKNVLTLLFGQDLRTDIKTREDGRQNADHLVERYFTTDLRNRVYTLYKEDFEAFGYDK